MIEADCVSYIPVFVELNISFPFSFIIVSQSWRAISHITYSKYAIGSLQSLPLCSCVEVFLFDRDLEVHIPIPNERVLKKSQRKWRTQKITYN